MGEVEKAEEAADVKQTIGCAAIDSVENRHGKCLHGLMRGTQF